MKTRSSSNSYFLGAILGTAIGLISGNTAFSQCSVVSTNGYTVNISITPIAILPSTANCTWGYNFNYKLNYDISFSGANIPSSLNTLQGNVLAPGFSGNFFDLPNSGGLGVVTSVGNSYTSMTNCNTVTVASLNASLEIQIQGPGISNRTVSCPAVGLPIELTSFEGKKIKEGIMLDWITSSEKNNHYFSIERSTNAVDWEILENKEGAGNSERWIEYSYKDESPINGLNYYRLKQTDFNGKSQYSTTISVDFTSKVIESSIYPNPTNGSNVHVSIITSSLESIEIQIFNALGQKSKSYYLGVENGFVDSLIELPESGNMFLINILQNNIIIGKHQVLVR